VDIDGLGIKDLRAKRGFIEVRILKVLGPDGAKRADTLADALILVLGQKGVKIARPAKKIRIRDFDGGGGRWPKRSPKSMDVPPPKLEGPKDKP